MLNVINIMGRLVKDPEIRRTANGTAVTSFCIACDRDFASKEDGKKETDFFDCVAWRTTAEFVSKYFTKGSLIALSGSLQTRSWKDKDGNAHKAYEILTDRVYFGGAKDARSAPASDADTAPKTSAPASPRRVNVDNFEPFDDDDGALPF